MAVLLVLSLVALFIFGKKWWMIAQAGKIDKNFMNDIRDYIHDGKIKSAQTFSMISIRFSNGFYGLRLKDNSHFMQKNLLSMP